MADDAEEKDMDALLMKVPEAAAQLGVSRAKLYELIAVERSGRSRSMAAGASAPRISETSWLTWMRRLPRQSVSEEACQPCLAQR